MYVCIMIYSIPYAVALCFSWSCTPANFQLFADLNTSIYVYIYIRLYLHDLEGLQFTCRDFVLNITYIVCVFDKFIVSLTLYNWVPTMFKSVVFNRYNGIDITCIWWMLHVFISWIYYIYFFQPIRNYMNNIFVCRSENV